MGDDGAYRNELASALERIACLERELGHREANEAAAPFLAKLADERRTILLDARRYGPLGVDGRWNMRALGVLFFVAPLLIGGFWSGPRHEGIKAALLIAVPGVVLLVLFGLIFRYRNQARMKALLLRLEEREREIMRAVGLPAP